MFVGEMLDDGRHRGAGAVLPAGEMLLIQNKRVNWDSRQVGSDAAHRRGRWHKARQRGDLCFSSPKRLAGPAALIGMERSLTERFVTADHEVRSAALHDDRY